MKTQRKHKISNVRLSKIITNRECRSAQDYLVSFYDRLCPEDRQVIKEMFNRNKYEIQKGNLCNRA